MKDFNQQVAEGYDDDIRSKIVGYEALQELVASIAVQELPESARILVIGCGTGAEIQRLETAGSDFAVTGLDPSAEMLAIARSRVQSELHCASLADFQSDEPFDCAVCVLVTHFVSGAEAKRAFFERIAAHLKPGGLLIAADYLDAGMDRFQSAAFQQKLGRAFFPVTEAELRQLMGAAGFEAPEFFFNSIGFMGYLSARGRTIG